MSRVRNPASNVASTLGKGVLHKWLAKKEAPLVLQVWRYINELQLVAMKVALFLQLDRSVVFHKTEDGMTTPQDYRISKT